MRAAFASKKAGDARPEHFHLGGAEAACGCRADAESQPDSLRGVSRIERDGCLFDVIPGACDRGLHPWPTIPTDERSEPHHVGILQNAVSTVVWTTVHLSQI